MKFFKSIRFKLTLWYSLLLIFLSLIFIITINVFITYQYKTDPIETFIQHKPRFFIRMNDPDEERAELISKYREYDLYEIRKLSILSFIPLTFFSFVGGYLISDQMLRPLKELNTKMTKINVKNLRSKIRYENNEDEISELIGNFNKMIVRLAVSFDSQKEFVENASHELKTPLTIIQTNLESSLANKSITKKEYLAVLGTSLKSTKFMNKLIEDLLLLSLLENHIRKVKCNLVSVIIESISQVELLAKEKNISVGFEYFKKHKFYIRANRELIQRAFMNILENSIKYSHKNKKIEILLRKYSKNIRITIKDYGKGVPKKDLEKVFDRFYRVDKSRSRKTGGVGLGLSITKKIIELHKGKINIKSIPNKGTTVTILFPIK